MSISVSVEDNGVLHIVGVYPSVKDANSDRWQAMWGASCPMHNRPYLKLLCCLNSDLLVGGLEHFFMFPYIASNHPN